MKKGKWRSWLLFTTVGTAVIFADPASHPATVQGAQEAQDTKDTSVKEDETDNSDAQTRVGTEEEEKEIYLENEWGFVEQSLDISKGIPEDAQGRLDKIKRTGRLTIATEPYFPPQEFIDPSLEGQEQYVGSDMELARLIAGKMEVELEIVPMSFAEVLSSVTEGTVDLAISGLSFTPGRAGAMELSKGYYFSGETAGIGILIRKKDADKIKSVEDLENKNIIAQMASLQEAMMVEKVLNYREFRRVSTMEKIYTALEKGISDAAFVDVDSVEVYLNSHPDSELMLVPGVNFIQEEQYNGDRVAAPRNEIQLICFVNGVIDEVVESGQYNQWYEEYARYAKDLPD